LEEITRKRRVERAQLKKEKLATLQGVSTSGNSPPSLSISMQGSPSLAVQGRPLVDRASSPTLTHTKEKKALSSIDISNNHSSGQQSPLEEDEDYEHLQLSLEEAFFLVFAVECIAVSLSRSELATTEGGQSTAPLTIQECWLQFAKCSLSAEKSTIINECSLQTQQSRTLCNKFQWRADNPFIVRYVVYHYFRSQGWIVKDGLKYGTDFLLYRKGMVFGHSQYAVKVIPCSKFEAKEEESDRQSEPLLPTTQGSNIILTPAPGLLQPHSVYSWQWLLTLNRVVAQVQKVRKREQA
jgi:tRNA-splicing endonuclease subunit Sen2